MTIFVTTQRVTNLLEQAPLTCRSLGMFQQSETYYLGIEFKTVAAVAEYLAQSSLGRVGPLPEPRHARVLAIVKHRHPYPAIFVEGSTIRVGMNLNGVNTCLIADIPGRSPLRLRRMRMFGESTWGKFMSACRAAIQDQTSAVSDKFWSLGKRLSGESVLCPVTLQPMTPGTSDVDHVAPMSFARIVHLFDEEIGKGLRNEITICDRELAEKTLASGFCPHPLVGKYRQAFTQGTQYDQTVFDLSNPWAARVSAAFQEFHQREAVLRVVSSRANREILPALARADERGDFDY